MTDPSAQSNANPSKSRLAPIAGAGVLGFLVVLAGHLLFSPDIEARPSLSNPVAAGPSCVPDGQWLRPATGDIAQTNTIVAEMAKRPVVLLGETHDNYDHHRWQLQMLAALHGANPNMVVAFEMFPRAKQPVLDRWIRGELTEPQFLQLVEWDRVWGIATDAYMPLFHFARMNQIPMIAMNVDRSVVRRVAQEGLNTLSLEDREGVSLPAAPPDPYIDFLAEIYGVKNQGGHGSHGGGSGQSPYSSDTTATTEAPADETEAETKAETEETPDPRESEGFKNFVDAQALWDRAMAEAIYKVQTAGGDPLVVGIVGRGHLQYGHGIPHQLVDLGLKQSAVLLPGDDGFDCSRVTDSAGQAIADVVFGVNPPGSRAMASANPQGADRPRLQLGVVIGRHDLGVKVERVVEGSVAETTGIRVDDVIRTAAGQSLRDPANLVATVRRQAPGTWLPLTIDRDGRTLELVAKFPPKS